MCLWAFLIPSDEIQFMFQFKYQSIKDIYANKVLWGIMNYFDKVV